MALPVTCARFVNCEELHDDREDQYDQIKRAVCKLSLSRTALLALLDGIDIVIKDNGNGIKKRHP
jgi:hypothetical protein